MSFADSAPPQLLLGEIFPEVLAQAQVIQQTQEFTWQDLQSYLHMFLHTSYPYFMVTKDNLVALCIKNQLSAESSNGWYRLGWEQTVVQSTNLCHLFCTTCYGRLLVLIQYLRATLEFPASPAVYLGTQDQFWSVTYNICYFLDNAVVPSFAFFPLFCLLVQ